MGRPKSARPSGRPAARTRNQPSKAQPNDNKAVANDEDMMQWLNEIEGDDRTSSLDVPTVKRMGPAKRKKNVKRTAKKVPDKAKPVPDGKANDIKTKDGYANDDADNSDLSFLDNFTYAADKEAEASLDISLEDQSAVSSGK